MELPIPDTCESCSKNKWTTTVEYGYMCKAYKVNTCMNCKLQVWKPYLNPKSLPKG